MTFRTLTLTAAFLTAAGAALAAQPDVGVDPDGDCMGRKGEQGAGAGTPDGVTSAMPDAVTKQPGGEGFSGSTAGKAQDANREIVKNPKPAEDGSKVAQTGPAEPTENWFGCNPDKVEDDKAG